MTSILGEYWITLDFLDSEAHEVEQATGSVDQRVGGVVTREPSDGTAMVVFQIEAASHEEAYAEAVELYADLRATAGLAEAAPLAGTITTLREPGIEPRSEPSPPPPPPPYRRLLNKAKALNGAGEYEYAVVAAQTACEVAIGDAMRSQLARQSSTLLQAVTDLIGGGRWAMTDKRVQGVWAGLTGDGFRQLDFWPAYDQHTGRRHKIVHAGGTVTEDEAAASIAVAEQVCAYMVDNS
jgi:hypothetical protein